MATDTAAAFNNTQNSKDWGSYISNLQTQTPAPKAADSSTMEDYAGKVRADWDTYGNDQKKWGGIDLGAFNFLTGGKNLLSQQTVDRPGTAAPPSLADFNGDQAAYNDALTAWYNNSSSGQGFDSSAFNTNWKDQGASVNALNQAGYSDYNEYKRVEAGNRANALGVAGAFQENVANTITGARDRLNQAFDGRGAGVDNAVQQGVNTTNAAVNTAFQGYKDTIDRADQAYADTQQQAAVNTQATVAQVGQSIGRIYDTVNNNLSALQQSLASDKQENLSQIRDTTAMQLSSASSGIKDQVKQGMQAELQQLQAMGYGADSPQAQAAARNWSLKGVQTIGDMASKVYTDFNKLRTDTATTYDQVKASAMTSLRGQGLQAISGAESEGSKTLAGARATGLQATTAAGSARASTVGTAAATLTDAHIKAASIVSDLYKWGEGEKNSLAYNKSMLDSYINQLELQGHDGTAKMLLAGTTETAIPQLPFLQSLFGTQNNLDQQNFANTMATLNFALNAATTFAGFAGVGPAAAPKAPSSSGTSFLGPALQGSATVGAAAIAASDREIKTDIQPIDPQEVLQRVVDTPVYQWKYKEEDNRPNHMGPMAQDFKAQHGLGRSDKEIQIVDALGVLMASVQALAAKVVALEARLKLGETN